MNPQKFWTNDSVRLLSGDADPISAMTNLAQNLTFDAIQMGWNGPPYDPFTLAEILNIEVVASESVTDAQTVPTSGGRVRIEFNPNRGKSRIRYSVAHEIAHTLFPDCAESVRHRGFHQNVKTDEWQLELLCNVAAAELLMPVGSIPASEIDQPSLASLLDLRKKFEVSTEAILRRLTKLTKRPILMFAASAEGDSSKRYRVEYSQESRAIRQRLPAGTHINSQSCVSECTAIGYTATAIENWPRLGPCSVECVGIPPYPEMVLPRVVGLVTPATEIEIQTPSLRVLKGDATEPRGRGRKIIAQVVNDKGHTWGAGFALAIRKKFPAVQNEFKNWVTENKGSLRLGNTLESEIDADTSVVNMIAQSGYGPSSLPRLRYAALKQGLMKLADIARDKGASVHMPKIGTGEAGGNWLIIRELIDEELCERGIDVTVYELPDNKKVRKSTTPLFPA